MKTLNVSPAPHAAPRWLTLMIAGLGSYALLGGLVSLLGWILDVPRLADWQGKGISIKANPAIATMLCGAALLLVALHPSGRGGVRVLGTMVALLGGLTLLEHLTGWNPGLDTLFFDEPTGARATSAPGRMGIPASTSFTLLGTALLLLTGGARARRVSAGLGLAVTAIATLSMTGYLYGAEIMFTLPRLTGIAAQTASMIFALGVAMVASLHDHQPMRTLLERSAAGLLARRVLPFIIVLPLTLGWARVWIQQQGLVDTAFGTAMRTLLEVALLIGLLWWALIAVRSHEKALSESAARKSAILSSALDSIISMDEAGRVVDFNPAAERTFGYARDEIMGRTVEETIVPAELRAAHREGLARFLSTGEGPVLGRRLELLAQRADGSRLMCELAITATRLEGTPPFFTAYLRDITERKQAEAALLTAQTQLQEHARELEARVAERTDELQASNEQLEAFVYSIAHDLRAPLRSMNGFSQLLLDEHAAPLNEVGRNFLQRIQASSEFMDKLLLDLLAYGRTARAEMELGPVEVQRTWESALFQTASQLEQTRARVEVIGAWTVVRAHEATLGQCLANLLSNALKFVAPGVTPQVRFRAEEMAGGANIRLTLEDNGVGIAPEHQERAFRVFERLHGPRYAGTGIGLSIVRKGVERMGGRMGLESTPGTGSRFWIELPRSG